MAQGGRLTRDDPLAREGRENNFEAGAALFGGPKHDPGEPVDLADIATYHDPL